MYKFNNENKKDGCSDRDFNNVLSNFRKCSQRSADVIFQKFQNQDFAGKVIELIIILKRHPLNA